MAQNARRKATARKGRTTNTAKTASRVIGYQHQVLLSLKDFDTNTITRSHERTKYDIVETESDIETLTAQLAAKRKTLSLLKAKAAIELAMLEERRLVTLID